MKNSAVILDFDYCLNEAKHYKTKKEWKTKSYKTFNFARKNNFLNKIISQLGYKQRIPYSFWTYKKCKESSLNYSSRTQWKKGCYSSYNVAQSKGWIDKLSSHMYTTSEIISINNTKWTLEKCKVEALKYNTKTAWQDKSPGSYSAASKKGWITECSNHMKSFLKWDTKEACIKDAKRFTKKGEWNKKAGGSYRSALNNGWMDECTTHMRRFRTLEDCKKEALKYKTKAEWLLRDQGTYWSAYDQGWYKECTKHMIDQPNCDLREKRATKKFIKKLTKTFPDLQILPEYILSKRSVPDIVIKIKNKVLILEVKHDESLWKKIEIKRQLERYSEDAKFKYHDNFIEAIICSPNGRYGVSFKETVSLISQYSNQYL